MTARGKVKGVRKRGNKYFIDYRVDGKRVREVVGTSKKQAELLLSKRQVEVVENRHFDVRKKDRILFDDFVKTYIELHSMVNNKPRVVMRDQVIIKNLLGKFKGKYLNGITPIMVEAYKSERLQTVITVDENGEPLKTIAPATVNRELACLKSIFNKAILWKKAAENPVKEVKLLREDNKRLAFLTEDKIIKLIDACSDHLKPIVIAAVFTGMRKGEILNLKWEDVNFNQGIISLLDTKNGEKRMVLMNDIVSKTIAAIERVPDSPYVFVSRTGNPYTEVRKSFSTALTQCGINNFRFHDLRHTYASQLVMMGVDIKTVQELMGHKTIEMTLRYSHLSSDHKRLAVDKFGNKMGSIWAQAQSEANKPESSDSANSLKII